MKLWPFGRKPQQAVERPETFYTGLPGARWVLPGDGDQALQLATAWACIRLTAMAVASLPKKLYVKTSTGREEVEDSLAAVICRDPNLDQTELEFWESMVGCYAARGNAYALKTETAGYLSALTPVRAQPMRINGDLRYRVWRDGRSEDLPREKVLHLKGFSFGGDEGLSPIRLGTQSLGAAFSADETAAKLFENGLQQPLFIDSGQAKLTPDQRKDLREMFSRFAGSDNAGKTMVLEAGMKPLDFALNPEDAQMLETRRFNVEEICRWFGVPPMIVGHAAQGQTMWGSGVEQIMLAWLTLGLNPICRRIEQRISKQLIPVKDRGRLYVEFNREGLLQMDAKSKAQFLSSMTQNGLMTRNEGRSKLNLPASTQAGANDLTVQTALAPIDELSGIAAQQT